jgi:hypothetical protein
LEEHLQRIDSELDVHLKAISELKEKRVDVVASIRDFEEEKGKGKKKTCDFWSQKC